MRRARAVSLVMLVLAALVDPVRAQGDGLAELEKQLAHHQSRGALLDALRVAERILELQRARPGSDAEVESAMERVALQATHTGDYVRAMELHEELLRRVERRLGPDAAETGRAIGGLAAQYWYAQRYDEAEKLFRRQIALERKREGGDGWMVAHLLQLLGGLFEGRGSYSAAEHVYLEAQRILVKKFGADDSKMLGLLMALGGLYLARHEFPRARALFDRVLAVYRKSTPDQVGTIASNISLYYQQHGRDDLARPLMRLAMEAHEKRAAQLERQDPAHPDLPMVLGELALLHKRGNRLDRAEALYRRAYEISRSRPDPTGWLGTAYLVHLASTIRDAGRPGEALPLLETYRALYRKKVGARQSAWMDGVIAGVHREMGQYRRAEPLLRQVARSAAATYGENHPQVGDALESLAVLFMAAGQPARARVELEKALAIAEPHLELMLSTGTELDHATSFARISHQLDLALTLHGRHAPRDARAARLAMATLLRRKGRILDAAASSLAALRARMGPDDRRALDQLARVRARLARLILVGPGAGEPEAYGRAVAELELEAERLEDGIRRRSALFRARTAPIELGTVQRAIPRDAVLVELVSHRGFDARSRAGRHLAGERRYAAYLLRATGDPRLVDLGPAAPIDAAVEAFLAAISDPESVDVADKGRALHALTTARLAPALGSTTKILLAPDGALALVPFGALTDERGEYLLRRYAFTYLTSGRELVRTGVPAAPRTPPVIVADPNFADGGSPAGAGARRARRSRDLGVRSWQRLPGTAAEANALARMLGDATRLVGTQASEKAIKQLRGPRILHIATHGFFLPGEGEAADAAASMPGLAPPGSGAPPASRAPENPLLRSGLVLAGANRLAAGDEDGVLTALEAAGLDLAGTELVVLSACETGVGKATDGDGVHGLRRALVIAGARSLVMTLWQVDDLATRDLMIDFYRRLQRGDGPSAALRRAQLEMLSRPRTRHPYYWASFVPAGAWEPLAR